MTEKIVAERRDGKDQYPTPTVVDRPTEGNMRAYRRKVISGSITEAEAEAILRKSPLAVQGKMAAHPGGSSLWPTPNANEDGYRLKGYTQQSRGLGSLARREAIAQGLPGQLNPDWVEWLMGYPIGWTINGAPELIERGWEVDPAETGEISRIASGVLKRKERLMALGNAVVPQIPELIGRVLLRRMGG